MRQRNLCVELAETGDSSEVLDPDRGPESLREKSYVVFTEKRDSGPGNRYGYKIEEFKS